MKKIAKNTIPREKTKCFRAEKHRVREDSGWQRVSARLFRRSNSARLSGKSPPLSCPPSTNGQFAPAPPALCRNSRLQEERLSAFFFLFLLLIDAHEYYII